MINILNFIIKLINISKHVHNFISINLHFHSLHIILINKEDKKKKKSLYKIIIYLNIYFASFFKLFTYILYC